MKRRERTPAMRLIVVMTAMTMVASGYLSPAWGDVSPTVTTGKDDYFANEVVDMYGSNFVAGASYDVVVIRPDGSVVLYASSEDGTHGEELCYDADASDGTACSQTVTADGAGSWTNYYRLNGLSGSYLIQVYAGDTLIATGSFLDAASLGFTGSDGFTHTTSSTAENLGTVPQTVPLTFTCPRGTGLTFQGSNFGSTEIINWSIGYVFGPSDQGSILQPLTTFTPSTGAISASSSSTCISPVIATSTLSVGSSYYGILQITTSEAGGRVRTLKYHFVFSVTDPPPPPECVATSYAVTWHQPIDPGTNTLNSQVINTTKLGRVVPLKVNITDNCGEPIDDLSGIDVSLRVYEVSQPSGSTTDGVEQYVDAGQANNDGICFRWAGDFWIYNFDTSNQNTFGALQKNKVYKAEVGVVDDTTTACDVSGRTFADPDALLKMMR